MNQNMNMDLWVEETTQDIISARFKVLDVLFSQRSEFQKVDIIETAGFGRMLLNDGLVMLTEKDEFVYHDMISHVSLFVHPHPEKVLIIGGGDGGTAREVLRHKSVKKCVMVEIDEVVVEACKKFIQQTSCSFDDPRLELLIADGVEYMRNSKEVFDLILIDSTDPIGPAAPLFGTEFYSDVFNRLSDDGIVVAQGETPFFQSATQKSMLKILSGLFPKVHIYNFSNVSYPGGLWSFAFASKKYCPIKDFDAQKVKQCGLDFNYYNSQVHKACFCLPTFMYRELKEFLTDFSTD